MCNPETYGSYDAYLERFQAEAGGQWSWSVWPSECQRTSALPSEILPPRGGGGLVVMVDAFNTTNQATIQRALQDYPLPHIVRGDHSSRAAD